MKFLHMANLQLYPSPKGFVLCPQQDAVFVQLNVQNFLQNLSLQIKTIERLSLFRYQKASDHQKIQLFNRKSQNAILLQSLKDSHTGAADRR